MIAFLVNFRRWSIGLGLFMFLVLAGCEQRPLILVATPIPQDANFRTYQHPSGVFSLRLPPDWSIRDLSQGSGVRVEFSPPNNMGLPLTVYVLNTGTPLGATELLNAIQEYQTTANKDGQYHETSRTAQGDGSWRMTGIRQTPIGSRQINTFMQGNETFLSILEADVTELTAEQLNAMQLVLNTYRVNPKAVINTTTLQEQLSGAVVEVGESGVLRFTALYSWVNAQGVFIINGQVVNTSSEALEAVRITALLYDQAGTALAEQGGNLTIEVLGAGQSAPFSIRFRNGKPRQTIRYELQAAARSALYSISTYLGDDKFIRGNDVANYNADGYLTVSGDVVNQTQATAHFVKAVVTVFDEQGHVVATETVFLAKSDLLPSEVAKFEVVFYELGGNAARYEIHIEGKSG